MYILIIVVKVLVYLALDGISIEQLDWVPFLTLKYQDERNIDEARFFIHNNINPYIADQLYQKPLLVYPLSYLKDYSIPYKVYFLIVDLLIGYFITKFGSEQQVLQIINQTIKKTVYRRSLQVFYHINPITFFSLLAKNTDGIDILTSLLSIYILQTMNGQLLSILISAGCLALSIYLNPNHAIFFSVIMLLLKKVHFKNRTRFLSMLTLHAFLTIVFLVGFLFFSFQLTNNSLLFVDTCYIEAYFPRNHHPTLGFIWALFSGLFTRYKTLYHALFAVFPLCFIFPFYSIFTKYGITKKDKELKFVGLSMGCCYFVYHIVLFFIKSTLLYFHQVTAMSLFIVAALLLQGNSYIFRIQIYPILLQTPPFIAIMAFGLQLTWTQSLTGNPNFLFFQCFVFYLFAVVIVSETLKEFIKVEKESRLNLDSKISS